MQPDRRRIRFGGREAGGRPRRDGARAGRLAEHRVHGDPSSAAGRIKERDLAASAWRCDHLVPGIRRDDGVPHSLDGACAIAEFDPAMTEPKHLNRGVLMRSCRADRTAEADPPGAGCHQAAPGSLGRVRCHRVRDRTGGTHLDRHSAMISQLGEVRGRFVRLVT